MTFQQIFQSPFRTSRPARDLGDVYDVLIDGRGFEFDRENQAFGQGIQSLPLLRQQSDSSTTPGEASINREDLWRKSQSSWHHGAGQRYLDKEDSDAERFWASQGVDIWTRDELKLLFDTEVSLANAATNGFMVVAGDYIYVAVGTGCYRFDGATWTSIPFAGPTGDITSLTTNGYNVYATTASQAYTTSIGTTTWIDWIADPSSGSWDYAAVARNRLLAVNGRYINEMSGSSGETPTQLNSSEFNGGLRWTAISEGNSTIYAASVAGNRSQIFRISPPPDSPTAALGAPIPAAPALPTGETVSSLYGYLGQLVIGTNKGVRVAEQDTNGNLSVGALIETPEPVLALNGNGSFVDFAWSNFNASVTGLGRINLAQLVDNGVYAYATDIMAAEQGAVTSVVTFEGKRYFFVAGHGVYTESDSYVESGWLESGQIRHGIVDTKIANRVEVRHTRLSGSVSVALSADRGDFVDLGTNSLEGTVAPTIAFRGKDLAGTAFAFRLNLDSGVSGTPVIQHIELRSAVVPSRGEVFYVPILLYENSLENYIALKALANGRRSFPFQYKSQLFTDATIQDYQFQPEKNTQDSSWLNGTMVLRIFVPGA